MGLALLFKTTGCASHEGPGIVYYIDGAGGGGLVGWASDVEEGLRKGGYEGEFKTYNWQTGLGAAADHLAPVDYKLSQSRGLAKRIQTFTSKHPEEPVCVMALSAGTAVALFAMEQLPAETPVDVLFLLAPSVSADYRIGSALQRVRHRVYVYTSRQDVVLDGLVEVVGAANEPLRPGDPAGLNGFRRDYAKVEQIEWKPQFERFGHAGGHTDVTNAEFVGEMIAPQLMRTPGFRYTLRHEER
jgi:hypothetical protein